MGAVLSAPKFRKFWLESNGPDNLGSVRLEHWGTPIKVVHFDRFAHFGRKMSEMSLSI